MIVLRASMVLSERGAPMFKYGLKLGGMAGTEICMWALRLPNSTAHPVPRSACPAISSRPTGRKQTAGWIDSEWIRAVHVDSCLFHCNVRRTMASCSDTSPHSTLDP